MKQSIKNALGILLNTSIENIEAEVVKYDVISFDIFDTLVKRNVNTETDVFLIIQEELVAKYGLDFEDFAENRRRVEKQLRNEIVSKNSLRKEEITLVSIYEKINDLYISKGYKNIDLIDCEIKKEIEVCVPNISVQKLYDRAVKYNKTIIVTSDMYLDESTIRCILEKCGYNDYQDLYLSSMNDKSKYYGTQYKEIRDRYRDKTILHIGDNVKSDWYMARKNGLHSKLVYKNTDNTQYWKKSKILDASIEYDYLQLKKIISNACMDLNPYERVGYEILGPLLYGFCNYLHKEFTEKKYNKIFFFSRDGLIIQKVYNMLFPGDDFTQCYMYVSRLSVSMGLLSLAKDSDEMLEVMNPFLHDSTVGFIGRLCNIDETKYEKRIVECNLSLSDDINVLSDKEKSAIYKIIFELGRDYFREQLSLIKRYFDQINFWGNIAVVDIGWNATSQKLLERVIEDDKTKIEGYYIGVFDSFKIRTEKNSVRNGYLFSPGVNDEYYYMTRLTLLVYDLLFISTEGSTIGYQSRDGLIKPIFGEPDYHEESKRIVEEIQHGAIKCAKLIKDSGCNIVDISPQIVMNYYYNFAVNPKNKTLKLFDSIYLSDVDKIKLLPRHRLTYYLFHIKELKDEMKKNVCKVWFFKWLFKMPGPYFVFLRALLKRKEKWDTI